MPDLGIGLRRRVRLPRRLLLAAAVVLPLLALLVRAASEPPASKTVRGILLDVRSSSIIHAESITLLDDQGRIWTFRVDPEVTANEEERQTASHLRQHMVFGDPMLVRYRESPDGLLAFRVIDDETDRNSEGLRGR